MVELARDFDEFFGSLIAHEVEFLVVGAYALAFHGAPRFTGDIDVFLKPTTDNATRFLSALSAFGFPSADLQAADVIDPRRIVQMGVEPVQIHVTRRGRGAKAADADRMSWPSSDALTSCAISALLDD
jgi:hypothetical protein